jgi:small-conductance mechanosensitive channel
MIQLPPVPTARDTSEPIHFPVPEALDRWVDLYLQGWPAKLAALLVVALLLYALSRVVRRQTEAIEDVNRRHQVRTWFRYAAATVFVFFAVALFADALAGFGTVFALLAAAVAIALQDVLKSVVGWLHLSSRTGVQVGARVEVNGVVGDVIDVGVLKTTVMEVGNLVFGNQTTGRVVTIPNFSFLSQNVFVETVGNPYVWQELRLVVTYESDWEAAEAILREAGDAHHAEIAEEVERGFVKMQHRFAYRPGKLTPIVYTLVAENGVDLTLRFLTHARRRRGSMDRITRQVLRNVAATPRVELAYPTHRLYRLDEPVAGRGGAAAMHPSEWPEGGGRGGAARRDEDIG